MAAVVLVQIARPHDPGRKIGHDLLVAEPEATNGVTVPAVPLRPEDGEVAHLVAPHAQIPGLGDELGPREDGILVHDVEERRGRERPAVRARERGGEVEAEAVDVHLGRPVAEAVRDELERLRAVEVERVAAAREILVLGEIPLTESVVHGVIEAAQAHRGPGSIPHSHVWL